MKARAGFVLQPTIVEGLRRAGEPEGLGVGALISAGLMALLHRYTDQESFAVRLGGAPLALDFSAEPDLGGLAQQARALVAGEAVVLEVAFEEHGSSWARRRLVERLSPEQVDLRFELDLEGGEVRLRCLSTREWLDEEGARMLGKHLEVLLQGAVSAPRLPISRLPLLTPEEWQRQVYQWNRTAGALPERRIHTLFEEQVALRPEAPAIVAGTRTLSYAELDRRAEALARRLRRLGVGPDVRVQLAFERSIEMVVAVLGVLKAGGAYVPLDPAYPPERFQMMVEDTRGAALLTQPHLRERFAGTDLPVLELGPEDGPDEEGEVPAPAVGGPDDLAYVIYTSGSSGRPKGVMIEHRGLVNVIRDTAEAFGVRPGDRVLQFSSLSFDVSVWDMFACLTSGACLVLVDEEMTRNPRRLTEWVAEQRVTVMFLLASVMSSLEPAAFPSVRLIVTGGELFSQELVDRWAPGRRLFYVYGPTEATIFQSWLECPAGATVPPPTVGRPMVNLRYYLVDRHLSPVPVGVAGELCIAGFGVGRGYVARPELNAEKFLTDPFLEGPPALPSVARMYRSGDRAVQRPDGNLDFLGRVDRQVKVRGFRIEPGEIESCLAKHPGLQQGVVVARPLSAGEVTLVAFVVPYPEAHLTPGDVKRFVEERLPSYMVPSRVLLCEVLPRSPNGKVDRRALLALEPTRSQETPAVAPRDERERVLLEIWQEVLGTDDFGVRDDFFELGGHSLKAMRALARIRQQLGVELSVRELFVHRTIEQLAEQLSTRVPGEGGGSTAPIPRIPDAPHHPISDGQRRLWLVDQSRGDSRIYNTPLAFVLEGRLDEQALEQALRELVARHESLRTTLVLVGGEPRQRVGTGEDFRLERRDCSSASDPLAAARELAREDAHRPFDLARGPLFRAHLIRCGPERFLLALNLHHVICDSWSLAVLTRELRALYAARVSGLPSPLAPLPVQYRDFSAWRRQLLDAPALATHRAYWLQKLARPAEPLALPIDHPRPPRPSGRGAIHPFDLGPAEYEALGRLAESTSSSLFVVLTSLVKVLLYRYTHQRDISVGTAVAGRGAVELEDQIGLFVNTVVLRDVLEPQASLRTLVEGVRQTAVDAYAYQDYPYDALVEELGGSRQAHRHPLFDVWVLLQEEQPMVQELGPGVLLRQEEWSFGISLFDLSFQFEKRNGGLRGRLQYDSALYEPATIELMVERFLMLVRGATERPDETLERLEFLSASERAPEPVRPFDGFRFG